jgi:uncharacterized protein (TIGR03067 family)
MRTFVCLLALASAGLAFAAAPPARVDEDRVLKLIRQRIAALITQLGDEEFDVRESASQSLDALDELALPALKTACTNEDAEIRRRAKRLVAAINQRVGQRELARWEGEWRSGNEAFHVKGDRWYWGPKGYKPQFASTIQIIEVTETMTLADLRVKDKGHPRRGGVVKAIFRLQDDVLHYCGTYDRPRPTEFVHRGDPHCVAWKRVRSDD